MLDFPYVTKMTAPWPSDDTDIARGLCLRQHSHDLVGDIASHRLGTATRPPPGERALRQVLQPGLIGQQSIHQRLDSGPIIHLDDRPADGEPGRHLARGDNDAAQAHRFIEAKGFVADAARAQRDFGIGEQASEFGFGDSKDLFDTMTMWATIEHVSDPASLLQAAMSQLKVGGMLHLDTGIGNDWMDRWLPGNVQWYDPPQHLFVFSEQGMRRLCERVGFKIVRYTGCFERSPARWWLRVIRNGAATMLFAGIASALGLSKSMKQTTRFPMGNLQSISLQRTR